MKGLVIAPQPFFSPRGTPFSVYHRCLVMSKMGVELDLMTYGQGQDVDLPNVSIHRGPAFRWLGDVPIGPSFLKLFHDVFLFASTGWRLAHPALRFRACPRGRGLSGGPPEAFLLVQIGL